MIMTLMSIVLVHPFYMDTMIYDGEIIFSEELMKIEV